VPTSYGQRSKLPGTLIYIGRLREVVIVGADTDCRVGADDSVPQDTEVWPVGGAMPEFLNDDSAVPSAKCRVLLL